jgi:hypothetical protein
MEQSLTVQRQEQAMSIVESVIAVGDLAKLTPAARVAYYKQVCDSLGLNPLTRPFEYIVLNGRLTLYARRDATDQLRRLHRVSIEIVSREKVDDVYIVTARARMPDGRTDEATGAVSIANLRGDALANALMKAETKAKRRVTLSIVGLGWLDETEIETIAPGEVRSVQVEEEDMPAKTVDAVEAEAEAKPGPAPSQDFWNTNERRVRQALIKTQATKDVQERLIDYWKRTGAGPAQIREDLAIVSRNIRQWSNADLRLFWSRVDELGISKAEVHERLGVVTLYLWRGTLEEAFEKLSSSANVTA